MQKKMNKRQSSILQEIRMKKKCIALAARDAPSLAWTVSSLSAETAVTDQSRSTATSGGRTSEDSSVHSRASSEKSSDTGTKSAATTTLLELLNDEKNDEHCVGHSRIEKDYSHDMLPSILGKLDDASLASHHGLIDVKEEGYWFDDESDALAENDDNSKENESDHSQSDYDEEAEECEECEVVETTPTLDSEDSLINGIITIDLQPKIASTHRQQKHSSSQKKQQTLMPKCLFHSEVDMDALEEQTDVKTCIRQNYFETLNDNKPSQEQDRTLEVKLLKNLNEGQLSKGQGKDRNDYISSDNQQDCNNDVNDNSGTIPDGAVVDSSINNPPPDENRTISYNPLMHRTSSNYISPRQHLAHKCLHDALEMMQRKQHEITDIKNGSSNAAVDKNSNHSVVYSEKDLHSLTYVGCTMMLKKKKEREDKEKGDREMMNEETSSECEENNEEVRCHCDEKIEGRASECDEKRDDSAARERGNEDRDGFEITNEDVKICESTVGATSIISYIGSIAVDANSLISYDTPNITNQTRSYMEKQDAVSSDSEYIHIDSYSNTGSSYIGTAIMHDCPIRNTTTLNSEDRITQVPPFKKSCGTMLNEDDDLDLMQVETTPTVDETLSVELAPSEELISIKDSQSFESVGSSCNKSLTSHCGNNDGIRMAPSQDSANEKDDTLSPLPPQKRAKGNPCFSPASHANSYATSIAASSTSASDASDVFGLLRGAYNHVDKNDVGDSEMHEITSSSQYEKITGVRPSMLKKKRSKSMTSIHDQERPCLTLGGALMATEIFTPPRAKHKTLGNGTPSSAGAGYSRRCEQAELTYDSIGATFSPLRSCSQYVTRPQSVVYGAVTSPTPSMFSGYTEVERTALSIAEDIDANPAAASLKKVNSSSTLDDTGKREEMKVLAIAEEMVADDSDAGSEDEASVTNDQLAELIARVKKLEEVGKTTSARFEDSVDTSSNRDTALNRENDPSILYERVKWLEKILGVGRGGANKAFETEILVLREKLSIVEQRLEEEMELKALANRTALSLRTKLGGLNEEKELVDKCLRNEILSLKSQLAFEQVKTQTAESDVKAALSSVLDLGLACEKKDEVIADLRKANKEMLERQSLLENDLLACAQGNDALRSRVLALASDGSTKEHTLTSALTQLKSLSENFYKVQKQLEDEKKERHDEVTSLQFSLDDMSRQMLSMSRKMNILETENADLRNQVKRLREEKEQTQKMRRSARGF
ncbi:hypothetical protein HJC23_011930 [Cyclotella cryptica]|uniref:Uncharacterized protein n=1 Tax=Cyclotella cryptica TaxID=29204 RepID=A0ABD3QRN1_9STRA